MKELMTELKKLFEDGAGASAGGAMASSASLGAAPTPAMGQVTVNGKPWTTGKSYKAKKHKSKKVKESYSDPLFTVNIGNDFIAGADVYSYPGSYQGTPLYEVAFFAKDNDDKVIPIYIAKGLMYPDGDWDIVPAPIEELYSLSDAELKKELLDKWNEFRFTSLAYDNLLSEIIDKIEKLPTTKNESSDYETEKAYADRTIYMPSTVSQAYHLEKKWYDSLGLEENEQAPEVMLFVIDNGKDIKDTKLIKREDVYTYEPAENEYYLDRTRDTGSIITDYNLAPAQKLVYSWNKGREYNESCFTVISRLNNILKECKALKITKNEDFNTNAITIFFDLLNRYQEALNESYKTINGEKTFYDMSDSEFEIFKKQLKTIVSTSDVFIELQKYTNYLADSKLNKTLTKKVETIKNVLVKISEYFSVHYIDAAIASHYEIRKIINDIYKIARPLLRFKPVDVSDKIIDNLDIDLSTLNEPNDLEESLKINEDTGYEVCLLKYTEDGDIEEYASSIETSFADAKAKGKELLKPYLQSPDNFIVTIEKGSFKWSGGNSFGTGNFVYGFSNKNMETTMQFLGNDYYDFKNVDFHEAKINEISDKLADLVNDKRHQQAHDKGEIAKKAFVNDDPDWRQKSKELWDAGLKAKKNDELYKKRRFKKEFPNGQMSGEDALDYQQRDELERNFGKPLKGKDFKLGKMKETADYVYELKNKKTGRTIWGHTRNIPGYVFTGKKLQNDPEHNDTTRKYWNESALNEVEEPVPYEVEIWSALDPENPHSNGFTSMRIDHDTFDTPEQAKDWADSWIKRNSKPNGTKYYFTVTKGDKIVADSRKLSEDFNDGVDYAGLEKTLTENLENLDFEKVDGENAFVYEYAGPSNYKHQISYYKQPAEITYRIYDDLNMETLFEERAEAKSAEDINKFFKDIVKPEFDQYE